MPSEAQLAPLLASAHRVGVIDIGSNSIRLVVYDTFTRTPLAVFNEKVLCGLGRAVAASGRLDSERCAFALKNLARFAELTRVMELDRVETVATAAVRDAENGARFVDEVERRCKLKVRVLTGEEEAELSALGVVAAIPEADGLMGDIGGLSLELVALDRGRLAEQITLPLGPYRIASESRGDAGAARALVDRHLDRLSWLSKVKERTLYIVGGNWRALARIHMAQSDYPLRVIHHYTLLRDEAQSLAGVVAGLSGPSLKRIPGPSRERRADLPLAALALERLLRAARPARVVFSAFGLREGILYKQWDSTVQSRDPLIDACVTIAEGSGQLPEYGFALHDWIGPLFDDEQGRRPRLAACLLGDLARREHPDYRAEHAFYRVLRLPVVGIDHPGRAFLALAVSSRYRTAGEAAYRNQAMTLLDDEQQLRARVVGLAIRLGDSLSAKSPDLLRLTSLDAGAERLVLDLRRAKAALLGEAVEKRLTALAAALGLKPVIWAGAGEEAPRVAGGSGPSDAL